MSPKSARGRHARPTATGLGRRTFLGRPLKWGLGLGALAAMGGGGYLGVTRELLGWRRPPRPAWQLTLPRPVMVAHRGGAGVFPENTLTAFTGSAEQFGCRWLDLDARCTRDGAAVVLHDATVERTTDGAGPVLDYDLGGLQRLDAGFRFRDADGNAPWRGRGVFIPTLRQVLETFPDRLFTIEIKSGEAPCPRAVVQAVRAAGAAKRVLLGAASQFIFAQIRELGPEIPSFFTFRAAVGFFFSGWLGLDRWYRPPHHTLQIPPRMFGMELITPELLAQARRAGVAVLVWTVNDPARMETLLEQGVDGIVTDRPDLLAPLVAKYQGN